MAHLPRIGQLEIAVLVSSDLRELREPIRGHVLRMASFVPF
jgi:hypothetical protein